MSPAGRPLVWLRGEVKSPPFSGEARREAGYVLRLLPKGEHLGMPQSRSMPIVGKRCRELRIDDVDATWRILYRPDADAVLILEVFEKRSTKTPQHVIDTCKQRLKRFDALTR